MTCFADTSGFIAIGNTSDPNHAVAARIWHSLKRQNALVLTTSYVIVETVALLQNRFGIGAVRTFYEELLPVVTVEWVDPTTHAAALNAVMVGGRRGPSMVDCASFEVMRTRRIRSALAFDHHFTELGYQLPD